MLPRLAGEAAPEPAASQPQNRPSSRLGYTPSAGLLTNRITGSNAPACRVSSRDGAQ